MKFLKLALLFVHASLACACAYWYIKKIKKYKKIKIKIIIKKRPFCLLFYRSPSVARPHGPGA